MNTTSGYFIVGTDTEIGKTLVSSTMLFALGQQGARAAGMKPVAAGAMWQNDAWHNEDADRLAASSNVDLTPTQVSPYVLRTATAPHIAAHLDGTSINLTHIDTIFGQIRQVSDVTVVEGVGGFRVPLGTGYDTADMAVQFGLPIVLVVGLRLGCLNHALLTAEAIAARGLTLAGWVANTVDAAMPYLAENVETLKRLLDAPLLGVVPRLPEASAAHAATHLDFSRLPGWPARHTS